MQASIDVFQMIILYTVQPKILLGKNVAQSSYPYITGISGIDFCRCYIDWLCMQSLTRDNNMFVEYTSIFVHEKKSGKFLQAKGSDYHNS